MKMGNVFRYSFIALAAIAIVLGVLTAVMAGLVGILNEDLYGRLTETQDVGPINLTASTSRGPLPKVRLVLHRVLPDENAVEASIVVSLDRSLFESYLKDGEKTVTAYVRDATTIQPIGLASLVTVDSPPKEPGLSEIAVESERFRLPVMASMMGYPYDDIRLEQIVYLSGSRGFDYPFDMEVQKALPGRLLRVSIDSGRVSVVLRRSFIEKTFVILSGVIFLSVCVLVAFKLFSSTTSLSGIDEILAVAGFLLATAEFRSLLDIPRTVGIGVFELAVFGIPLLLLAVGLIMSTLRSDKQPRTQA